MSEVTQDERGPLQWMRIGPLTYLNRRIQAVPEALEYQCVAGMDTSALTLAVGARAARGIGVFLALLVGPNLVWLIPAALELGLDSLLTAPPDNMPIWWQPFSVLLGFGAPAFALLLVLIALVRDFFQPAENLVLFKRHDRKLVAVDPRPWNRRPKAERKLRFVEWDWDKTDFAIERAVITGGQVFHLRAVQRDARGQPHSSVVLVAMIPTFELAQSVFEFIRCYMAGEFHRLPREVPVVPRGRLGFFESCRHSFITSLFTVRRGALPDWPAWGLALLWGFIAFGCTVGWPFVLGKVLAEWSSRELKFPKGLQAPEGSAVPGVTLLPARTMQFAPHEKLVYAVGLVLGALFWVWLVRYLLRVFGV